MKPHVVFVISLVALVLGGTAILLALLLHGGIAANSSGLEGAKGNPGIQGPTGPAGPTGTNAEGFLSISGTGAADAAEFKNAVIHFSRHGDLVHVHMDPFTSLGAFGPVPIELMTSIPTLYRPTYDAMGVAYNITSSTAGALMAVGSPTTTGNTEHSLQLYLTGAITQDVTADVVYSVLV